MESTKIDTQFTQAPTLPEMLTTAEVAAVLRCCQRTVYRLISCGALPDAGLPKKILIPRPVLEQFLTTRVPNRVGRTRHQAPRSTTTESLTNH